MFRTMAIGTLCMMASGAAAQEGEECSISDYAAGLRYQQQSAEVAALQIQGYNVARMRLETILEDAEDPARLAVVFDLDETVIDNTPLLARDLANCHQYDQWDTWRHWEREGEPALIPGAAEFLDYVDEQGVTISYISDRTDDQKDATIATLNDLDLPQVTEQSVQLLGPPKEGRRSNVSADHQIVMLLGDSLPDFEAIFDVDSLSEQRDAVMANAEEFGSKWIVFPNAAYGAWTDAELDAWDAETVLEDY